MRKPAAASELRRRWKGPGNGGTACSWLKYGGQAATGQGLAISMSIAAEI